jgi:thiol-disulfide isomerase/thioredoxin
MKILLPFLFLAFAFGVRAESAPPDPTPLFAATLWDADDRPFALGKLRGKPLVVNFWARWCGPCRVEIPELAKVQQRLKDKGLVVVGIGLEDKADTVREFARAYDMDYLVLLAKGQGNALMHALGNPKGGLPYTLIIDADGRVVAKKVGLISRTELDAATAALFR